MNINITEKDFELTDAIKSYITEKVSKLQKNLGDDFDAVATLKIEGNQQVAEIRVTAAGAMYKAVAASKDLYASIDKDIDVLEGQIRKAKTKKEKQTKEDSIKLKEVLNGVGSEVETEGEIVKALYYEIKPISVEDAKLKLQEKPTNNFLTFINVDTNKVNVIFKLKDGKNYGLVEPEV